ncbi:MAG: hypothetical protein KA760_16715 [Steroidobacteraceae bacterium]|nr:hypothetical protein [Steroidobacteraceae bacterium]
MNFDHQPQPAAGEPPSAPLYIIAYVDGRMREHTEHVETILREHVADEMCRFGEIQGAIKALRDRAEELELRSARRHEEIMGVLAQHTRRIGEIEHAFLVDHKGDPDFQQHHGDHSVRAKAGAWWADVRNKTTTKLIEWAALLLVAWVLLHMWTAFLKGPMP